MLLHESLGYITNTILSEFSDCAVMKYLHTPVIKEFSMSGGDPWLSWQEFGTHKEVKNWYLLDSGHAVGFNENPSRGWSFPVKKLSPEMFERAKNHTLNYEQYHSKPSH